MNATHDFDESLGTGVYSFIDLEQTTCCVKGH